MVTFEQNVAHIGIWDTTKVPSVDVNYLCITCTGE
jgi:hypothetical protein